MVTTRHSANDEPIGFGTRHIPNGGKSRKQPHKVLRGSDDPRCLESHVELGPSYVRTYAGAGRADCRGKVMAAL